MPELFRRLEEIETGIIVPKPEIVRMVTEAIAESGYTAVEIDDERQWGAYFRLDNDQANPFIEEFFPDLNPSEARGGNPDVELTPKILLVAPGQRLSWQYHNRRAEIWRFLTEGSYNRSMDDEQGDAIPAHSGEMVEFGQAERHRLNGLLASYSLVAEIWRHTDPSNPSDESDIIRLADDYNRAV